MQFGIKQKRLVENLEKIRKQRCAYTNSEKFCDCKFGKENEDPNNQKMETFSGCCEIRQVSQLIQSLSEIEFENYCNLVGIIL